MSQENEKMDFFQAITTYQCSKCEFVGDRSEIIYCLSLKVFYCLLCHRLQHCKSKKAQLICEF